MSPAARDMLTAASTRHYREAAAILASLNVQIIPTVK